MPQWEVLGSNPEGDIKGKGSPIFAMLPKKKKTLTYCRSVKKMGHKFIRGSFSIEYVYET